MNQVKVRTSLAKCNFFPGEFTIPEKSDTLSAGQWLGGRQKVGKHPQTGSDQTRGFLLHRIKHDYRQTTKSLVKHGQRSMHVPMSGSLYSKPSFVRLFIHLFSFLQHINSFSNLFFLHSPASRAKMTTVNTISKIRGQQKVILYPQPEGTLGEYMIKHGRDLGDDNCFGELLCLYNCTLLKKKPYTIYLSIYYLLYISIYYRKYDVEERVYVLKPKPEWSSAISHFGLEMWPRSHVLEMTNVYGTLASHLSKWQEIPSQNFMFG